jgi:metallo-beta-lactamase family protein
VPLPTEPVAIDWVVLTHAHIDHTGYLPRLRQDGYRGSVYATRATAKLAHPGSGGPGVR